MNWPMVQFEQLYSEPSRNGVYKSNEHHGEGAKIVNMGELFAYDIIGGQEMKRLRMNTSEMRKSGLMNGDLLFGRRSLVESGAGKCSLVDGLNEPTTFESSIIRVRVNNSLIRPRFIFYWLKSPHGAGKVRAIVTGTNVKGIRGTVLKTIKVPYPSIDIQDAVISTLRAYDDLIENNQRRIQLLEQAAWLLYKEWFIHLRFPGHEHVKTKDGVPDGWKKVSIPDIIEINPKETITKGTGILYIPMSSLSTSCMAINTEEREIREKPTSVKFRNDDTLFARITPCLENGKTGFVNFLADNEVACGSTEFIVLRGYQVSPYFTYCLARTYDFRENAIKSMIGSSGRQRVQVSCFGEYKVGLPNKIILDQFDDIASKCFRQISFLMKQNIYLQKARDLLLPRLMNGEVAI
ncbi:MAG: restriction endonuclease subunit S [Proteobacteria bacterium]|nr:restriction endonuclease subunit S [Pseudomonadota bacterium]MBU4471309.1 restriction endonuclease subunit S [Pseudomonadota bacterium]MCG2751686.1 restriction endonuclease subunit S [Desulfobacteraceae bacterium]